MVHARRVLALSAWLSCSLLCAAYAQTPAPASLPATVLSPEPLDLDMYSRIRDEGFNHSHVMEYAGPLFDDIGPRLTGSPAMARANEWTRAQLAAMGCSNAHLESWGDFGMAWTQHDTSVALSKPSSGVFHAQATPWSPATNGMVMAAPVIAVPNLTKAKDLDAWKGKLRGKVILYGRGRTKVDPDKLPEMQHYSPDKLSSIAGYPLNGDMSEQDVMSQATIRQIGGYMRDDLFQEQVGKFFHDEGAVAILVPGGSGGVLHDDTGSTLSWFVYEPQHRQVIPEAVVATENYDRVARLLEHKVPVSVDINIATEFGDEHAQGYNTIAEIPGTDPALKDEVVMVGGHLDSWIGGTGATDNGAGAIVAMEAMRILTTLGVHPRRTIRIALWSGEEQGIYGSFRYVAQHFATFHSDNAPGMAQLPDFVRPLLSPTTLKPEGTKLDAYFNLDNGTGKLLGVYTEGNEGVGEIFSQWIQPIRDLGVTTISERNTGSTDHVAFQEAGLPGFQFIQDPRDYEGRTHHTDLDTYEHLSEPDLKQAAVVEAIFLYNTAQRDAMLPRPALPGFIADKPLPNLYPDAVK